MAQLNGIRVYPIKGFDGTSIDEVEIRDGGTLAFDREFALFDADDEILNGKRTEKVHDIGLQFDPDTYTATVEAADGDSASFDLEAAQSEAQAWFRERFDEAVVLKRDSSLGFVDRQSMGPSVISTATLRTVASWFDDVTVDGARRRIRANIEISDVPPFWEDRFVGDDAPDFTIDGVRFEGVTPCGRCVVPQRDPDTGDPLPKFRERFIEKRRETFPDWADEDAFDHYYTLMLIATVQDADRGKTIRVGDPVSVVK